MQQKKLTDEPIKVTPITSGEHVGIEKIEKVVPHEEVKLASRGIPYPEGHPLSSGVVRVRYMTARDEDILTTKSFIKNGTVFDELYKALLMDNVKYNDLLTVDRTSIMLAARSLSYGAEYEVSVDTPSGNTQEVVINIDELPEKDIDFDKFTKGQNLFLFTLPKSGREIGFKLLTVSDEKQIDARIKSWKKVRRQGELTARLRQLIVSVDGETNKGKIATFIDEELLAADSRALRDYIKTIQPGVDLEIEVTDEVSGEPFRTEIAFGFDLFYPDSRV